MQEIIGRYDETEVSILTQCNQLNSDLTVNIFPFKLSAPWGEQGDFHCAVGESGEDLKKNWNKDLTLPHKYSAYRKTFINLLT